MNFKSFNFFRSTKHYSSIFLYISSIPSTKKVKNYQIQCAACLPPCNGVLTEKGCRLLTGSNLFLFLIHMLFFRQSALGKTAADIQSRQIQKANPADKE